MNMNKGQAIDKEFMDKLVETFKETSYIDPELYTKFNVKRGLRNADGSGVLAGLTVIGNVHGYIMSEGEMQAIPGVLYYRGINLEDIVKSCEEEDRFGFEEVAYLIMFGKLPTHDELAKFNALLAQLRELPSRFTEDVIVNDGLAPDLMYRLSMSTLALYGYDNNPDSTTLKNMMRQSIELIARFPTIIARAYQVKKHYVDKKSMVIKYPKENASTAENFLYALRPDGKYTDLEAKILDLLLMLHAEHGGGNNSAFACRVLSSSGTDTYSAIAAAIGSLKGPLHGGANFKVSEMHNFLKNEIKDWKNDDEVSAYLEKMIKKEAGDKSGLIYGMGHAVYTLSDPRALILRERAMKLAEQKGLTDEFELLHSVERLAPDVFAKVKGGTKRICANVDLYSGYVYKMMDIPQELFTPLFAMSRITGWCAHRIEEWTSNGRIIRPAYKNALKDQIYIPINER